jgi:hypothetical protein
MNTTFDHPQVTSANEEFLPQPQFNNLSRLAAQFCIRVNVIVESRILCEFSALEFSEDMSTAKAILCVLAFRHPVMTDGILSVCLVHRRDGRNVAVALRQGLADVRVGHETIPACLTAMARPRLEQAGLQPPNR